MRRGWERFMEDWSVIPVNHNAIFILLLPVSFVGPFTVPPWKEEHDENNLNEGEKKKIEFWQRIWHSVIENLCKENRYPSTGGPSRSLYLASCQETHGTESPALFLPTYNAHMGAPLFQEVRRAMRTPGNVVAMKQGLKAANSMNLPSSQLFAGRETERSDIPILYAIKKQNKNTSYLANWQPPSPLPPS